MCATTRHTLTFDLPIQVGAGDDADTDHVKVMAVYNCTVEAEPMCNVIEATIVLGAGIDETFVTLLELTQAYFDDKGYDMAVGNAERQRDLHHFIETERQKRGE